MSKPDRYFITYETPEGGEGMFKDIDAGDDETTARAVAVKLRQNPGVGYIALYRWEHIHLEDAGGEIGPCWVTDDAELIDDCL